MESFHKRLQMAMDKAHMSQVELCEKTKIPKSAMSQYVSGSFRPRQVRTHLIAMALNVSEAWLMGYDVPMERPENQSKKTLRSIDIPKGMIPFAKEVPLIGGVACGEPIYREEDEGISYPVPQGCDCDYCMRCHGDSMTGSGIQEGDIVYIKQMPMVDNGQMAAVRIENEYTLKIVYYDREANLITLVATNPAVAPLSYHGEQLDQIEIIGQAVGVYHDLIKQGGVL